MLFKELSDLQLCRPFYSTEQNLLCNSGRGHYEKHFNEIILNFDQWFRCYLKYFLSIVLASLFCLQERDHLGIFGRGRFEGIS